MIAVLFVALGILALAFVVVWIVEVRRNPDTPDRGAPDGERIAIGFFANFFDALGIAGPATLTTKPATPGATGVPEITPASSSARPPGSAPETNRQA